MTNSTARLMELIFGFQASRAICTAAELDIAGHLKDGARTIDELAQATNTRSELLYRLLRALAGLGIFSEDDDGRFEMTPLAEPLLRDAPHGSVHGYALLAGQPFALRPWEDLRQTLEGAPTPFDRIYGRSLFEYLADDPDASAIFNDAMTSNTSREAEAVVAAYDFGHSDTIVDVAGGHGALLQAILSANEQARGILFELSHVAEGARGALEASDVADRSTVIAGDMFATVPPGDAYLLKRVVHDWDDDRAREILERCREAMEPGGRVLVVDQVIPAGNEPHPGKFYDLMMLVIIGGRERTESDFQKLFTSAGLKLTRVVPTRSPVSIVEGEKI